MSHPFKAFRPLTEDERAEQEHDATLDTLRRRAKLIETREQLELWLEDAQASHRARIRDLMTPMLRPDLPCCALQVARLNHGDHSPDCPAVKAHQ